LPFGYGLAMLKAVIVEDEALIALDLESELQSFGIEVVGLARTAAEALDLARRVEPDLAIVDLMLNGHAKGAQIADVFRARGVKVLMVTGADAAQASGIADALLAKPWSREDLTLAIGALTAPA
jgi:DNA-binding response OmpR family regulator